MAKAIVTRTQLVNEQKFIEKQVKKHFLFFSWYETVSSKKVSDDLFIVTNKKYDHIFLAQENGVAQELTVK
jgi:hypothetical protein